MHNTDLVLGHAWKPSEIKSLNDYKGVENQDIRVTEANDILDEYFSKTFKPSVKIIQDNNVFFTSLRSIEEIFVLGHSYPYPMHGFWNQNQIHTTKNLKNYAKKLHSWSRMILR